MSDDPETESQPRSFGLATLIAVALAAFAAGVLATVVLTGGDDDDDDELPAAAPAAEQPFPDSTDEPSPAPAPAADPDDAPIGKAEADRVADAALAIAGGGEVTDLDRSDDPGEAWEVEVVRNGVETDIALDANLKRVPNQAYGD